MSSYHQDNQHFVFNPVINMLTGSTRSTITSVLAKGITVALFDKALSIPEL